MASKSPVRCPMEAIRQSAPWFMAERNSPANASALAESNTANFLASCMTCFSRGFERRGEASPGVNSLRPPPIPAPGKFDSFLRGMASGSETIRDPERFSCRYDSSQLLNRNPPKRIGHLPYVERFHPDALGRIPAVADHLPWHGWRFEVVGMDGNRIDKVLASPVRRIDPSIRGASEVPESVTIRSPFYMTRPIR